MSPTTPVPARRSPNEPIASAPRPAARVKWSDVERRVARLRGVLAREMPTDIAADRANNAALALMAADEGGDSLELRRAVVYLTLGAILGNEHAMRGHSASDELLERAASAWCSEE